MRRAAVYMRVSTAGQEQEQTIKNQEMELREKITSEEDTVLSPDCVYKDEGWSGAIIIRPDLDRMRQDAADGKFDILYIYDRGRLARKLVPQEIIMEELRNRGIDVVSLHDINDDSIEGLMLGKVMGAFHEYERLKITERMRLGKVRKVSEDGKLLGYNPKFGYDYHPRKKGKNGRDGYFSINEKEAEVVRKIFAWCGENRMSKYAIRAELYKQGLMPPKNRRKQWSTGVLDRMLRDTTYKGEHFYNKTAGAEVKNPRKYEKYRRHLLGSRIAKPREEWMLVKVPAIVTPELFSKVQVQLERKKRMNSRNNKRNNYLLSGMLNCVCGFARTGDPANGCTYYRCTDRLNHATGLRQCHLKAINSVVLDDLVWRNIKEMLQNPKLIQAHAKKWKNNNSPVEDQIKMSRKSLQSLDEQLERLIDLHQLGDINKQQFGSRRDEISDRRNNLIHEINDLESLLANQPALPLEKLVCGVVELLEESDFPAKREIIRTVVSKVVATQEDVQVWGFIPILSSEKVSLDVKDSNTYIPNQSIEGSNPLEIGLNDKYRHEQDATIPFNITFSMPPLDKRTRGYTPQYIKELQKTVGGNWE